MTDDIYEIYSRETHGPLLTPEQAVARLAEVHAIYRAEQRLAEYRAYGGGPPFLKQAPRAVRYPTKLLDAWADGENAKPIFPTVPVAPSVIRDRERRKKDTGADASAAAV